MKNEDLQSRRELIQEISRLVRHSSQERLVRFIKHPIKLILPKIICLLKMSKEIEARTFWGGKMNIVLPEEVSTFIWRYGYFEIDVCFFLLSNLKERMTFLDIGSHFGFFSLLASFLVGANGKVLAFEPVPTTYRQLQINANKHARYSNVETFNLAAYDENTELEFNDYGLKLSAYNSAYGFRGEAKRLENKMIAVKAISIDDFIKEKLIKKIDFIKIDVESAEIHALNGMRGTLEKLKPILIVELGDVGITGIPRSSELVKWLQNHNYSAFQYCNEKIVPHTIQDTYSYSNILFTPR